MKHKFYETTDPEAPAVIKDGNGEIVLSLCKVCGCAESSLTTDCYGSRVISDLQDLVSKGEMDYIEDKGWVGLWNNQ